MKGIKSRLKFETVSTISYRSAIAGFLVFKG